ncbi:MAG: DnaT-like ssDNA-binding protein [Rectinema subterraneum]|uniref:DnaT-like ssDNA-binding protein n=1 Tax=Rectinema subterraneum TaxID=2653714 RepID=UPI003C7ABF1C
MTIEDGTGLSGGQSYVRLEEADGYHAARGNGRWAEAEEAAKAAALVRACDWLERAYGALWEGTKRASAQRLSFPRCDFEGLSCNEIPSWLKDAQCEAALLELSDPGVLSFDASEGGALLREREGDVERFYAPGPGSVRRFSQVHRLVAGHIQSPAQIGIGRA